MDIRARDLRVVAHLWGELAEFPASQMPDALTYCLEQLARCIGAVNVWWVGACRDRGELRRWQPHGVAQLVPSEEADRRIAGVLRQIRQGEFDPQTRAMVTRAGSTRAFLRSELVETDVWRNSWLYNEVLRPLSIEDRLVGAHTIDSGAESYLALDRDRHSRPFGDRERDILALFLAGAPAFHREIVLSYGPRTPNVSLTNRERDILQLLLTDATPREIAMTLGLTWRTTHQYIVAVLRKFGVRGRAGLMAHWLRHASVRDRSQEE